MKGGETLVQILVVKKVFKRILEKLEGYFGKKMWNRHLLECDVFRDLFKTAEGTIGNDTSNTFKERAKINGIVRRVRPGGGSLVA